jgi:hypothetical protein
VVVNDGETIVQATVPVTAGVAVVPVVDH